MKRCAFTLAEILIVLVIIGILSIILIPMAFNSSPDEDVMKFKKGYNTIATVIRELVSSDKYYQNGDMGIRADGTMIDGTHKGDLTYFCESFADNISAKQINCQESSSISYDGYINVNQNGEMSDWNNRTNSSFEGNSSGAQALDTMCKNSKPEVEIVFSDGTMFYQLEPECTYGINRGNVKNAIYMDEADKNRSADKRLFNNSGYWNSNNLFDSIYKVFCFEIKTNNKDMEPFGIGIRADGKILNGARVNEWLNKSIQTKD